MAITLNGSTGITDADGGTVLSTADLATQAEAEAGTNNTKVVTPLRVAQEVGVANSAPVKSALNAGGSAPIYACRAWVNFNGTGTVAIRNSANVSSITDNGTGIYTVNFTTAMSDADYAILGTVNGNSRIMSINTQAAGSSQVQTRYTPSNLAQDCDYVDVAVFR